MGDVAFVNGRFMPLAEAMVSVEDRGFQFGDGVYEVIRTYHGDLFQLDAHVARLEKSAKAIALGNPYSVQQWKGFIREGIRLGGYEESKIYLQLTRGAAPRDHTFPQAAPPTVVMTIRIMPSPQRAIYRTGVDVMTVDDFRWGRCDIKSLNLLPNVMARQRAKEAGAFEAIFVRSGLISEGAVSNVMMVRGGVLMTPKEDERILSGITRAVVLDLARKEGVPIREQDISLDELRAADEVLLTGTTIEILPVSRVDGSTIGNGKPGDVTESISARFQDMVS